MAILIRKKYYDIDIEYWMKEWNCSMEEACNRFSNYSDEDLNEMFVSHNSSKWINLNSKNNA